jgi:hypothetical protein
LAIAVRTESIGSVIGAGAVNVIYGSSSELSSTSTPDQIWHQNVGGVEDTVEEGDLFGDSLAIADFNNDGFADIAIAVLGGVIGSVDVGVVNMIYGSAAGLTSTGNQLWHQNGAGVEEVAEDGDFFGSSFA